MNTKIQFLSISLLIFTINNQMNSAVDENVIAGIGSGIGTLRDQGIDLETLTLLTNYNVSNLSPRHINTEMITQFLNDQLQENRLNPQDFKYFVGLDQDWQIIKMTNKYALIIPDSIPDLLSTARYLWSQNPTEGTPSYSLNIQDLNKALINRDYTKIQRYKLAIIKAIVAAKSKGTFHGLYDPLAQTASTYMKALTKNSLPGLSAAFSAISQIDPLITANDQWVEHQMLIDDYILNSLDADLIQARIDDLKEQSNESKNSYVSQIKNYIPYLKKLEGYNPSSKYPLEEQIQRMENFLKEEALELKLRKAQINRSKNIR